MDFSNPPAARIRGEVVDSPGAVGRGRCGFRSAGWLGLRGF